MQFSLKSLDLIEKQINLFQEKSNMSFNEVINLLKTRKEDSLKQTIPISIFNKKLSSLEAIVKYLKENLSLNYKQISFVLNRNYDPIALTYRNSKKKFSEKLDDSSSIKIPLSVFSNKKLSVLENLTYHLKSFYSFHEIALFLNRNDRTIWTVYNRAIKKLRK